MLEFIPTAKLATQIVAGLGVSKILGDIIQNNVTITTNVQAISVKVSSYVLGSLLVEQSSNHIERTTNEIVAWLDRRKAEAAATK